MAHIFEILQPTTTGQTVTAPTSKVAFANLLADWQTFLRESNLSYHLDAEVTADSDTDTVMQNWVGGAGTEHNFALGVFHSVSCNCS